MLRAISRNCSIARAPPRRRNQDRHNLARAGAWSAHVRIGVRIAAVRISGRVHADGQRVVVLAGGVPARDIRPGVAHRAAAAVDWPDGKRSAAGDSAVRVPGRDHAANHARGRIAGGGERSGGLSISTVILGALLAPTTGAVGASVLTLGLLALPAMLCAGYRKSLACGVVCSAGTLGTVLPPSIILIVLADLMSSANAEAQIMRGEDVHAAAARAPEASAMDATRRRRLWSPRVHHAAARHHRHGADVYGRGRRAG